MRSRRSGLRRERRNRRKQIACQLTNYMENPFVSLILTFPPLDLTGKPCYVPSMEKVADRYRNGRWTVADLRTLQERGLGVKSLSRRFGLSRRRIGRLLDSDPETVFDAMPTSDQAITLALVLGENIDGSLGVRIQERYRKRD